MTPVSCCSTVAVSVDMKNGVLIQLFQRRTTMKAKTKNSKKSEKNKLNRNERKACRLVTFM